MEPRKDCGSLLKQINDEMRKNANNAMRAQDMTLAQLEALVQLEQAPDGQHSLKELEQLLHVAQSTAAGIISRLEQKGYAEGFGDAGDRRSSWCGSRRRAGRVSAPPSTTGPRRRSVSSLA